MLLELGLAHKLSWQECEALLDAAAPAPRTRLDDLLERYEPDELGPNTRWLIDYGNQLPPKRQASLMNWICFELEGKPIVAFDYYHGANPREGFLLELEDDNPGDHSKLNQRSREQLVADLKKLRTLPDTRWKAGRVEATIGDLEKRRKPKRTPQTA